MTKFYAKSTNSFYDPEINGTNIPKDAVQISDEIYLNLLEGQSLGKTISSDDSGNPILIDPVIIEPTYIQKRALEYPDFKEYLDGIVKNDQAQIDKYIADCLAVKAKYPKG